MLLWIRHLPRQIDQPPSAALVAGELGTTTLALLAAIGRGHLVTAGTILSGIHTLGLPVSANAISASSDPTHTAPGNIPCLNVVRIDDQSLQIQLMELEKLQPSYFIPKMADPISCISATRRNNQHPWVLTPSPGYPWGLKTFIAEASGKGYILIIPK